MSTLYLRLLACIALVASVPAWAGLQSLDSIQAAAEKEVSSQLPKSRGKHYVSAARLDPRLRLAQCAVPLETSLTNKTMPAARTTVSVRCAAPTTWTLYVAVSVEIEAPMLVLKRALARNANVVATDVELQTRRVSGVASAFIGDVGALAGRRLRRALPAGSPLTADALAAAVLVRRGQQVTLLASNGPFEIRAQGHALSDGSEHERIRVQNVTSRKIVEGVVESASVIRVDL